MEKGRLKSKILTEVQNNSNQIQWDEGVDIDKNFDNAREIVSGEGKVD